MKWDTQEYEKDIRVSFNLRNFSTYDTISSPPFVRLMAMPKLPSNQNGGLSDIHSFEMGAFIPNVAVSRSIPL